VAAIGNTVEFTKNADEEYTNVYPKNVFMFFGFKYQKTNDTPMGFAKYLK